MAATIADGDEWLKLARERPDPVSPHDAIPVWAASSGRQRFSPAAGRTVFETLVILRNLVSPSRGNDLQGTDNEA